MTRNNNLERNRAASAYKDGNAVDSQAENQPPHQPARPNENASRTKSEPPKKKGFWGKLGL